MYLVTRNVEFRTLEPSEGGDGRTLEGYAAVFDQGTEIASFEGKFSENISKGAFRKTISERMPVLQFDHGRDSRTGSLPIGVFEEIREDDHGLYVRARLFDNDIVEPIRQAIEAGAVSGMSFRMKVNRDEWRDRHGKEVNKRELGRLLYDAGSRGPLERTIKEVQMFEAGPVTFPAYEGTSVGVRSVDDLSDDEREQLIAEYHRRMAEPADDVAKWLEAERTHQWLEAERTYQWLEAERAHSSPDAGPHFEVNDVEAASNKLPPERDAARDKGTSPERGTPERDAAHKGTSHRDEMKEERGNETPDVRTRTMTLAELRERLASIDVRLSEMQDEYRDAEFPDNEQREFDDLKAERPKVEQRITAIENRMTELADTASTDPKRTERAAPAVHTKSDDIYDLDAIRASAHNQEDLRNRLQDNAKRVVERARYGGGVDYEDAAEHVSRSLADIDDARGTLAQRVIRTGSPDYERAWGKALVSGTPQGLNPDEYRALELGTDSAGGYAVPFQLDPTVILTSDGVRNPLRQISRTERIVGKAWQGVSTAGASVTRGTETAEAPDSSPTFAQPQVETTHVKAFVPYSIELDSAWQQVQSEVTRILADAKETEEASAFTLGDGVAPNANGVVGTLTGNTVATVGVGAFAAEDVYALEEALEPRYRHTGAKFLANHGVYNKIRQFATNDSHEMWQRIGGGMPPELLGYQVHEASEMSAAVTTTGEKILLFGDFSNFLIVDRVGMSVELVPQVFGANNRPTGQRGIFAYWFNNSKILVDKAFKLLVVA